MNAQHTLAQLLDAGPVKRRDHPGLHTAFDHALRIGTIVAVLPGVYLNLGDSTRADALGRAAMAWEPQSVISGTYAAQRQFWPELRCEAIDLAVPGQRRCPSPRFRVSRRVVPAPLVGRYDRVRMTRPALTAIDLCTELGAEVINRALRSRKVTPDGLRQALALSPQRAGNRRRRAEILDSAGNPWSYAERRCHRVLRDANIRGWRGNPPVWVRGNLYYPDILFEPIKLVVEIDGLHHTRDDKTYQSDVWRMNDFSLDRYAILRFTLADVDLRPGMVTDQIREMQWTLEREKQRRVR